MWRDFPEALCRRLNRAVIAYDRAGFGRSAPRTDRVSLNFIAEEGETVVPQLLDRLGLERVVLLGHSVGGSMAVAAAAQNPGLVSDVITLSAQAFVEQRTLNGVAKAKAFFNEPQNFSRLHKYHGEKARWVLDAWTETWLAAEFRGWSLTEALAKLRAPLLAIHGENDEYGSREFAETLARGAAAGGKLKILPDVGHVPFREAPDAVLDAVAPFLRREG